MLERLRLEDAGEELLEGGKGIGGEAEGGGTVAEEGEGLVAMGGPEGVPAVDALLLLAGGGDERGDVGAGLEGGGSLEAVEQRGECGTRGQGLVPGVALGDEVDVGGIVDAGRDVEVGQQLLLTGRHVVDVAHVSIERGVEAEVAQHGGEGQDDPEEPAMPLGREGGETAEEEPFGLRRCALADQMGQEDQHEEDGAYEHEGGEESQIAQGGGFERDEAGKGADGGDVAYEQRGDHLLQHLAQVAAVVGVRNEMQGVVGGYADDDGAYAEHYERHIAPHHGDEAHGEKPAEEIGYTYEHQVLDPAEGEDQHDEDEGDGEGDGPLAVGLDLCGIAHGDDRGAGERDLDVGMALHGGLGHAVEVGDQPAVVGRLHGAERGGEHGQGVAPSGIEDIAIVDLHGQFLLAGLQPVEHGREEGQRVGADARREESRGGHHDHLHVVGQLPVGIAGGGEELLHALIVTLVEQQGYVLIDEIGEAYILLEVDLRGDLADHAIAPPLLDEAGEGVDGIGHLRGAALPSLLHAEEGDDALSARDVLIEGQRLLIVGAHGQEVEDVLVVAKGGDHQHQQARQRGQQPQAEPAAMLEKVEDMEEEADHGGRGVRGEGVSGVSEFQGFQGGSRGFRVQGCMPTCAS